MNHAPKVSSFYPHLSAFMGAGADEDGFVPTTPKIVEAQVLANFYTRLNLHAQILDDPNLFCQNILRQAVSGYALPQHPTRLLEGLEDLDGVSPPSQLVCDSEAGRSGAYHSGLSPGGLCSPLLSLRLVKFFGDLFDSRQCLLKFKTGALWMKTDQRRRKGERHLFNYFMEGLLEGSHVPQFPGDPSKRQEYLRQVLTLRATPVAAIAPGTQPEPVRGQQILEVQNRFFQKNSRIIIFSKQLCYGTTGRTDATFITVF